MGCMLGHRKHVPAGTPDSTDEEDLDVRDVPSPSRTYSPRETLS